MKILSGIKSRAVMTALSLALAVTSGAAQGAPVDGDRTPGVRVKAQSAARERFNIDRDWRFAFGHPYDASQDFSHGTRGFFFAKAGYGDGPADLKFNDTAWRRLNLPHDWAVELPFSSRASANHGSKALGATFPENSVGWYRRALPISAQDKGRRIAVEFDGVFRDSVVWVNGHYIGNERSGYSSFQYDITDYLNYGGENVIAVRVDATMEEGWWYEGAGIYRHVWLTKTDPLHVAPWGTFVRTEVADGSAEISIDVEISNDGKGVEGFTIEHLIVDADGTSVARFETSPQTLNGASSSRVAAQFKMDRVRLWSLEDPYLYKAITQVKRKGEVVDSYDTVFGIRTLRFDANDGFFLNGKSIKLHGTNNHQDHAGVGVALPDALHEYRFKRLKEIGVNAYRASHHPPTKELLEAADRLGILVIDEHRMMGTTPQIRNELERMVRRDRNHPSVILWSVGNEEWAIENTEVGTRLTQEMQAIVRRMDPTRLTTVAASGSGGTQGTAAGSEVIGFNYKAQHDIDAMHKRYPDRPMLVTEEGLTFATRGVYVDDPERVHIAAYDKRSGGARTASIEEGWRFNAARPFLSGMFVWTGFDYRGETTPFGWPAVSSQFGMLDTTGVIKDSGYYLKSVWTHEPMVHLLPHWNWSGREGEDIDVRAYANTDEVELFLNKKSLGRKAMTVGGHLQWSVPYQSGKLVAKGFRNGKLVATQTVETTGPGVSVQLAADRTRIKADGSDISVITVSVADKQGRVVPTSDSLVQFETTGPIQIIGMGNGDPGSHEPDKPTERHHFLTVKNWRVKGGEAKEALLAHLADDDASTWRRPFQWVPEDQRPPESPYYLVRAEFARPKLTDDDTVELFVADVTRDQVVYVNGEAVAPVQLDGLLVIKLDPAKIKDTNSLNYLIRSPAGGFGLLAQSAQEGGRWASLRVTTPAPIWARRVFNGYAQIIVQSTGGAGPATVVAKAQGQAAATLKFTVQ
ncbi:beta-galactosidase GalA [Asticcacaulis machinosus]|uniref:Glycoside hydrolase family 2 TIM barrel-domain containing protein n=1 Tax=Asticcacaulis machinosus TaxID=2984211 RepID=A0ABT5HHJ9_9CAUL|nr:beta-galactosidase GalA [Asticcacaulis machinosus]MDC7675596.1 glycoside hydrolase family 2 TIM barrel-domain containing protein [Asticcacaulis machinosus]